MYKSLNMWCAVHVVEEKDSMLRRARFRVKPPSVNIMEMLYRIHVSGTNDTCDALQNYLDEFSDKKEKKEKESERDRERKRLDNFKASMIKLYSWSSETQQKKTSRHGSRG